MPKSVLTELPMTVRGPWFELEPSDTADDTVVATFESPAPEGLAAEMARRIAGRLRDGQAPGIDEPWCILSVLTLRMHTNRKC